MFLAILSTQNRANDINKGSMKKRFMKKSDVLREGYIKGLKKAQ